MNPLPCPPRRGLALLLVVIVIAALAAISVPFALSMHYQERAARAFQETTKARQQCEGMIEYARGQLAYGEQGREGLPDAAPPYDTPYWDGPEEVLWVDLQAELLGSEGATVAQALGLGPDERGGERVGSILVDDENGKVDLNSASPALLGNLLAGATLTEKAESSDTVLTVDYAGHFPPQGVLYVQGELVAYSKRTETTFSGCARGVAAAGDALARVARPHAEGALVVDARGLDLARWRFEMAEGEALVPYRCVTGAREIANNGRTAISADELDDIQAYLSVDAGGYLEEGWFAAQRLDGDPEISPKGGCRLPIGNAANFGIGSLVRVTTVQRSYHAHVLGLEYDGARNAIVPVVDRDLTELRDTEAVVEVEARRPVNVNAAPFRVLTALFTGVSGWGRQGNDSVSYEEAEALARLVQERRAAAPLQGLGDWEQVLADCDLLSDADRRALMINAQNANHLALVSSTAPLCFRSFDRYRLEATLTVLGPGSRQEARHREREVVLAAWPGDVSWVLDTQRDFREFVNRFGWMNRMATGPRLLTYESPDPDRLFAQYVPYGARQHPSETDGYIRLVLAREETNDPDVLLLESFASQPGDYLPLRGAYAQPRGKVFLESAPVVAGGSPGVDLAPGRIEFWFRPPGGLGNGVVPLVDCGEQPYRNRFALYWDLDRDELRFLVADSTLGWVSWLYPSNGKVGTLESAWTTVRMPLGGTNFIPGKWHHVTLDYSDTRFGGLSLLLDGVATYLAGGPPTMEYACTTGPLRVHLTGDIDEFDGLIPVDEAGAFPEYGSLQIGGEVIFYDSWDPASKTFHVFPGNQNGAARYKDMYFANLQRGINGTRASSHPEGAPVIPYGYSVPLLPWKPAEGYTPSGVTFSLGGQTGQAPQESDEAPEILWPCDPPHSQAELDSIRDISVPTAPGGLDFGFLSESTGGIGVGIPFAPGGGQGRGRPDFAIVTPLPTIPGQDGQQQQGSNYTIEAGATSIQATMVSGTFQVSGYLWLAEMDAMQAYMTEPLLGVGPRSGLTVQGAERDCYVFYNEYDPTTQTFNGVEWPDFGKPARNFEGTVMIMPCSVMIELPRTLQNRASLVECYLPSGLVEIEREWIEYFFWVNRDPTMAMAPTAAGQNARTARFLYFVNLIDQSIRRNINNLPQSVKAQLATAMLSGQMDPQAVMEALAGISPSELSPMRGKGDTYPREHPMDPAVDIEMGGSGKVFAYPVARVKGYATCPEDVATLVDEFGPPEAVFVRWRYAPNRGLDGFTYVAFKGPKTYGGNAQNLPDYYQYPTRVFRATPRGRIVKFPSGEMPEPQGQPSDPGRAGSAALPPSVVMGAENTGPLYCTYEIYPGPVTYPLSATGDLDELKTQALTAAPRRDLAIFNAEEDPFGASGGAGLNSVTGQPEWFGDYYTDTDTTLVIQYDNDLGPPDLGSAGIVKIGDEYVAHHGFQDLGVVGYDTYTSLPIAAGELVGCVRGFLGSFPAPIPDGTSVMDLTYADVTALARSMSSEDPRMVVLDSTGFPLVDGFVLVGPEIVGYTRMVDTVAEMPERLLTREGLYRGRFGTDAQGHSSGDIVYGLPYRHYDFYAPEADDPTMGYYQVARSQPDAIWRRVTWEESTGGPFTEVVCLARIDGSPTWDLAPSGEAGGLLFLDDPEAANELRPGEQLELRFFLRYRDGAYPGSHDWKDTPVLRRIQVDYNARSMVLSHEELR